MLSTMYFDTINISHENGILYRAVQNSQKQKKNHITNLSIIYWFFIISFIVYITKKINTGKRSINTFVCFLCQHADLYKNTVTCQHPHPVSHEWDPGLPGPLYFAQNISHPCVLSATPGLHPSASHPHSHMCLVPVGRSDSEAGSRVCARAKFKFRLAVGSLGMCLVPIAIPMPPGDLPSHFSGVGEAVVHAFLFFFSSKCRKKRSLFS